LDELASFIARARSAKILTSYQYWQLGKLACDESTKEAALNVYMEVFQTVEDEKEFWRIINKNLNVNV